MFSMLKGRDLADEDDEHSTEQIESLFKQPEPIDYNPNFPIETFDIIVTDEAHRRIYNLWRQVLEYFDAYLIGLTATPNKQTFGFFNQNLVMEYGHEQAVADGVNVNYDVYRIKTEVTEAGAKVEAEPSSSGSSSASWRSACSACLGARAAAAVYAVRPDQETIHGSLSCSGS